MSSRTIAFGMFLALLAMTGQAVQLEEGITPYPTPQYLPDEVLVKFAPGKMDAEVLARFSQLGLGERNSLFAGSPNALREEFGLDRIQHFRLEKGADLEKVLEQLSRDPSVEYAEPNLVFSILTTPNDPLYATTGTWGQTYRDMWGLWRIGLTPLGTESGWDVETAETTDIVVAVIDTGADMSHPDLLNNLWTNSGEIPGNGLDDDGNGFIDDVYGWNFAAGNNNPHDGHGHGTHCAGTIAAETNNALGVAGINWRGRIMVIKGLSDGGSGSTVGLAQAIHYAADNGAHILSNSWGGAGDSDVLTDAVQYATAKGCIVVAAAGNNNVDIGTFPFTPASIPETFTVAASDPNDLKAGFSNYGDHVAVTAPGVDILSLRAAGTDMYGDGTRIVQENYFRASGTSMACPHVSGALALLWTKNPTWSAAEVKSQLVNTADYIDHLNPNYEGRLGSGVINIRRALTTEPQPLLVVLYRQYPFENGSQNQGLDPGENVQLVLTLVNRWLDAENVSTVLESDEPLVTIHQNSATFGNIPSGSTASNTGAPFGVTVSSEAEYGQELVFRLLWNAGEYSDTTEFLITVTEPDLRIKTISANDTNGNQNGLFEPGESGEIRFTLSNSSTGAEAQSVQGTLISNDPRIEILQGQGSFGTIYPGGQGTSGANQFSIRMDESFPAGELATLTLAITEDKGYSTEFHFELATPGSERLLFEDPTLPSWPPIAYYPAQAKFDLSGTMHLGLIMSEPNGPFAARVAKWSGGFWTPLEKITNHMSFPGEPAMALDSQANTHFTWVESRMAPGWNPVPLLVKEIYHTQGGPPWSLPRGIIQHTAVEAYRLGALAVDNQDRPHAVWFWIDWNTNTITARHSWRNGASWTPTHVIGSPGAVDRNYMGLQLTTMPNGSLVMSWTQTLHDGNREFRLMRWQNGSWGNMQTAFTGSPSLRAYAIAPDAAGNLHLIYLNRNIHKLLYYRESAGTWFGPEEIGESTHYYEHLSLHLGTDNRLHAAFGKATSIEAFSRVNGVWSSPETLIAYPSSFALNGLNLLTDERGNRHLIRIGVENYNRGVLYHSIHPPASGQPNPTPTPPPKAGSILVR